jgi:hypothetical protein
MKPKYITVPGRDVLGNRVWHIKERKTRNTVEFGFNSKKVAKEIAREMNANG